MTTNSGIDLNVTFIEQDHGNEPKSPKSLRPRVG
jgi:hypothetical protein